MDSERRHELEENSLARALRRAPDFIMEYGAYVLLGVAVVLAVFLYFRNRALTEQAVTQAAIQGLYNMQEAVNQAEQVAAEAPLRDPESLADAQAQLRASFETYTPLVVDSPSAGTRSHALRLQGDFAWALAKLERHAAALPTTQPAEHSQEQWLDQARASYSEVVENYPQQIIDLQAALFGLAAIAEQRGDFGQARQYYEQVIEREGIAAGSKEVARQRQALLDHLRLNPRFGPPRAAAQAPADVPGTLSAREVLDRVIPIETPEQPQQPQAEQPQQQEDPADQSPADQPPPDQPPASEPD